MTWRNGEVIPVLWFFIELLKSFYFRFSVSCEAAEKFDRLTRAKEPVWMPCIELFRWVVLAMRYPSGTNLSKLCLPTDIHLSPAILLQEAFWSVKHPVELPQDLLQPGCNWVASFLLRLLSSPGLFMTIPNQKHSAFQLRLDPIRRSELDRTRILTESFSNSYNCSFHLFVLGSFWWNLQEAQGGSRFGGASQSQVEGKGHLGLNEVLWQERHAQEDAKRRKLREDLEGQTLELGFSISKRILGW